MSRDGIRLSYCVKRARVCTMMSRFVKKGTRPSKYAGEELQQ